MNDEFYGGSSFYSVYFFSYMIEVFHNKKDAKSKL